jgi:hypothetical protein
MFQADGMCVFYSNLIGISMFVILLRSAAHGPVVGAHRPKYSLGKGLLHVEHFLGPFGVFTCSYHCSQALLEPTDKKTRQGIGAIVLNLKNERE